MQNMSQAAQALVRNLLLDRTHMLNDHATWRALRETVVPRLFADKHPTDQVRVWMLECGTGLAAYAVADLLHEYEKQLDAAPHIQIFATDSDADAIAVARRGRYPVTGADDVAPEWRERLFIAEHEQYVVRKKLRDLVAFAPYSLLRDPPFARLDLIICRNQLIALEQVAREHVLALFHSILEPDGYLVLGPADPNAEAAGLFEIHHEPERIFQQRAAAGSVPPLPPPRRFNRAVPVRHPPDVAPVRELHLHLLAQHAPLSVLIDEAYTLMHLSRSDPGLLQLAEGEPSFNLLDVIYPDLRHDLHTALTIAAQQGTSVETRCVTVPLRGVSRRISMLVQPIQEPEDVRGCLMVVFHEQGESPPHAAHQSPDDAEQVVLRRRFERELLRTREQLQRTIAEYELSTDELRIANEELQTANEELQATNEELRAAHEELQNSREELQVINAELTAANQELERKIHEVITANNDLHNLLAATDIGTIFLDRRLRITRFTPRIQELFNLIPTDLNRPLAHLTHRLDYDQLLEDAAQVLTDWSPIERESRSTDGRWYLARLRPYRTCDDRIDGVVLTFVDITERKQAEELLRMSHDALEARIAERTATLAQTITALQIEMTEREQAEAALRASEELFFKAFHANPAAISITRLQDGRIIDVNESFLHLFELQREETIGRTTIELGITDATRRARTRAKLAQTTSIRDLDLVMHTATGQLRSVMASFENITLHGEQCMLSMFYDVTERKRAEEERKEFVRQLVTAQEDERHRIARELHDQMGQSLSALRLGLAILATSATPNDAIVRLQQIVAQIDEDVHRLVLELRPSALDELGLLTAVQQHVEAWTTVTGINAEFQAIGVDAQVPSEVAIVLYRVMQEALTNVLKHAEARHVSVILEQQRDQLCLIVEDDGRGFDPDTARQASDGPRRIGLLSMQERVGLVGGTFTLESAPGRGTSVFVRIALATRAREVNCDG